MTTVLLAPDKFKGSLTAAQVAAALARGVARTAPAVQLLHCPIADGGDGTVDAALATGFQERTTTITGPTGARRTARWALSEQTAVIEMALAVGLDALPGGTLAPHSASTRGLGELILAARDAGARTIVVGLGGSASTDAGAGMLQALGARLEDAAGHPIGPGAAGLADLAAADLAPARDKLAGLTLIAASDVTNPLLGPEGTTAVYGPQKGIAAHEIQDVDEVLACAASLLDPTGEHLTTPGAGAAGGTGFALFRIGAQQQSGADTVLELAGFDALLDRADLVITGEGKLDEQTLHGKGPAEVARRAHARSLPVLAVAGAITLEEPALAAAGITGSWDLLSRSRDLEDAITRGEQILEDIGEELGVQAMHGIRDGGGRSGGQSGDGGVGR